MRMYQKVKIKINFFVSFNFLLVQALRHDARSLLASPLLTLGEANAKGEDKGLAALSL